MPHSHARALVAAALVLVAGLAPARVGSAQATTPAAAAPATAAENTPLQFLYMLRLVPRLHDDHAWTDADKAAVSRHFERLWQATDAGQVILAGRTREPGDRTFGIVVFEAPDAEAARRFMEGDPAVLAGVMTATLHPYSVALLRTATPVSR
jgi:uncharacterized protein YciI